MKSWFGESVGLGRVYNYNRMGVIGWRNRWGRINGGNCRVLCRGWGIHRIMWRQRMQGRWCFAKCTSSSPNLLSCSIDHLQCHIHWNKPHSTCYYPLDPLHQLQSQNSLIFLNTTPLPGFFMLTPRPGVAVLSSCPSLFLYVALCFLQSPGGLPALRDVSVQLSKLCYHMNCIILLHFQQTLRALVMQYSDQGPLVTHFSMGSPLTYMSRDVSTLLWPSFQPLPHIPYIAKLGRYYAFLIMEQEATILLKSVIHLMSLLNYVTIIWL